MIPPSPHSLPSYFHNDVCCYYTMCSLLEPQREKIYLLTWVQNEDSNQPAHPRSLIRVSVFRLKKPSIYGHPRRSVKILIRLRKYAGWSESSLSAHVRGQGFWRDSSFISVGSRVTCPPDKWSPTGFEPGCKGINNSVKISGRFYVNDGNWMPAPLPYILRGPVELLQELSRRIG